MHRASGLVSVLQSELTLKELIGQIVTVFEQQDKGMKTPQLILAAERCFLVCVQRIGFSCTFCSGMAAQSWTCSPLYGHVLTHGFLEFYVNEELKKFPL